jgi:predicted RNA methylase/GGDEF domain-containing protein
MSKYQAITLKIVSIITLAAFMLTNCGLGYACPPKYNHQATEPASHHLRQVNPANTKTAKALGDELVSMAAPAAGAGTIRWLNDKDAGRLADGVRKILGLDPFIQRPPHAISGKNITFSHTKDEKCYRIGPVIIVSLAEVLAVSHISETFVISPEDYAKTLAIAVKVYQEVLTEKLGKLYTDNQSNIIFVTPLSLEIEKKPIGISDYTIDAIAAMLANPAVLQDSVFIDAGAGSGILSMVALRLGSHQAVLIENNELSIMSASELFPAQGFKPEEDFTIWQTDLRDNTALAVKLSNLDLSGRRVTAAANVGPWEHYGNANQAAIEFLTGIPALGLLINSGYLLGDLKLAGTMEYEDEHAQIIRGHAENMSGVEDFLKTCGFEVGQIRHGTRGMLIGKRGIAAGAAGRATGNAGQAVGNGNHVRPMPAAFVRFVDEQEAAGRQCWFVSIDIKNLFFINGVFDEETGSFFKRKVVAIVNEVIKSNGGIAKKAGGDEIEAVLAGGKKAKKGSALENEEEKKVEAILLEINLQIRKAFRGHYGFVRIKHTTDYKKRKIKAALADKTGCRIMEHPQGRERPTPTVRQLFIFFRKPQTSGAVRAARDLFKSAGLENFTGLIERKEEAAVNPPYVRAAAVRIRGTPKAENMQERLTSSRNDAEAGVRILKDIERSNSEYTQDMRVLVGVEVDRRQKGAVRGRKTERSPGNPLLTDEEREMMGQPSVRIVPIDEVYEAIDARPGMDSLFLLVKQKIVPEDPALLELFRAKRDEAGRKEGPQPDIFESKDINSVPSLGSRTLDDLIVLLKTNLSENFKGISGRADDFMGWGRPATFLLTAQRPKRGRGESDSLADERSLLEMLSRTSAAINAITKPKGFRIFLIAFAVRTEDLLKNKGRVSEQAKKIFSVFEEGLTSLTGDRYSTQDRVIAYSQHNGVWDYRVSDADIAKATKRSYYKDRLQEEDARNEAMLEVLCRRHPELAQRYAIAAGAGAQANLKLADTDAAALAEAIRQALGFKKFIYQQAFYINWGQTEDHRCYRIGPLVFIVLPEMRNLKPQNASLQQAAAEIIQGYKERLGDLYSTNANNIIFIDPSCDVEGEPIDHHRAQIIATMLAYADRIKDTTVFDCGAGAGLLSLVAARLGAGQTVLIERDKARLEHADAMLYAQGYKPQTEEAAGYALWETDLGNQTDLMARLKTLDSSKKKAIGLVNMGAWPHYGAANQKALEFLCRLDNLDMLINVAFYIGIERESPVYLQNQSAAYMSAATFLSSQGLKVEKVYYADGNAGALIATRNAAPAAGQAKAEGDAEVFSPTTKVVSIESAEVGGETWPDERYDWLAEEIGVPKSSITSCKGRLDKEKSLGQIAGTDGALTICFFGHGGENHIWLNGGTGERAHSTNMRHPDGISYEELAEALITRGNLGGVTVILDACYSRPFSVNLREKLKQNGPRGMPCIVSVAEGKTYDSLIDDIAYGYRRDKKGMLTVQDIVLAARHSRMANEIEITPAAGEASAAAQGGTKGYTETTDPNQHNGNYRYLIHGVTSQWEVRRPQKILERLKGVRDSYPRPWLGKIKHCSLIDSKHATMFGFMGFMVKIDSDEDVLAGDPKDMGLPDLSDMSDEGINRNNFVDKVQTYSGMSVSGWVKTNIPPATQVLAGTTSMYNHVVARGSALQIQGLYVVLGRNVQMAEETQLSIIREGIDLAIEKGLPIVIFGWNGSSTNDFIDTERSMIGEFVKESVERHARESVLYLDYQREVVAPSSAPAAGANAAAQGEERKETMLIITDDAKVEEAVHQKGISEEQVRCVYINPSLMPLSELQEKIREINEYKDKFDRVKWLVSYESRDSIGFILGDIEPEEIEDFDALRKELDAYAQAVGSAA